VSPFEVFYRDNIKLVYALAKARSINAADTEDLVQETFLRAWRCFHQLSYNTAPAQRAWLVHTLRNLATDAWRHKRCVEIVSEQAGIPEAVCTDELALRLDVRKALKQLPDVDREIVVLRYICEMDSKEIGNLLELPAGTVRRRLAQSRKYLAEYLSRE
jgi:RNA polymerase sigma-70 factor, ECF subfamily